MNYICPRCKNDLTINDDILVCNSCCIEYKTRNGVFVFFDSESDPVSFASLESKAHDDSAAISDEYMGMNSYHNIVLHDFIVKEISQLISNNSKILEIGSGAGSDIVRLAQKGFNNLHASDVSFKSILEAKNRAETSGITNKIVFYQLDGSNLPFKDQEFDAVFMVAAMHHFPVTIAALKEIKRCCKTGGYIMAFNEPNCLYYKTIRPISKFIEHLLSPFKRNRDIERSIAEEEAEGFNVDIFNELAVNAGLDVIKVKSHWFFTGFVYLLQQFFYRIYGKNPMYLLNLFGRIANFIDSKILNDARKYCWLYTVIYRKNNN